MRPAETGGNLTPGTILLVEDEPDMVEMVRTILEWKGYLVLTAPSLEKAKEAEAAFTGEISLLLTDIDLQSGTGLEVARYVRARRPHVMVIFMSGHPVESVTRHEDYQGGDGFISKPFDLDDLLNQVKSALKGSAVTS